MICEKCIKKLQYVRDVVGDPFMYCPMCNRVWVESNANEGIFYQVSNGRVNK